SLPRRPPTPAPAACTDPPSPVECPHPARPWPFGAPAVTRPGPPRARKAPTMLRRTLLAAALALLTAVPASAQQKVPGGTRLRLPRLGAGDARLGRRRPGPLGHAGHQGQARPLPDEDHRPGPPRHPRRVRLRAPGRAVLPPPDPRRAAPAGGGGLRGAGVAGA